jgi:hypothetical protein
MNHVMLSVNICKWLCNWKDDCFYVCIYVTLGFMFRHEFLKEMILTFYAYIYIYVFDADDELWLHKRVVSINYLLRVVLDFNSIVFMFYFNWMCVIDHCIHLIINLLILGAIVSQRFRMGIVPGTENPIIHIDCYCLSKC